MSGKISSVVLVQSTWELLGQSGGWGRNQEFVKKLVLRAAFFLFYLEGEYGAGRRGTINEVVAGFVPQWLVPRAFFGVRRLYSAYIARFSEGKMIHTVWEPVWRTVRSLVLLISSSLGQSGVEQLVLVDLLYKLGGWSSAGVL